MRHNYVRKLIVFAMMIFTCCYALACISYAATHLYSYCKETMCTNKTVYGSKYCSEHVCRMDGCKENGRYNGYCFKHKSWSSKRDKKPDSSYNACMINGCTMYRSRGYDYCSYHTCNKTGCHNQKTSGSSYCREHSSKPY